MNCAWHCVLGALIPIQHQNDTRCHEKAGQTLQLRLPVHKQWWHAARTLARVQRLCNLPEATAHRHQRKRDAAHDLPNLALPQPQTAGFGNCARNDACAPVPAPHDARLHTRPQLRRRAQAVRGGVGGAASDLQQVVALEATRRLHFVQQAPAVLERARRKVVVEAVARCCGGLQFAQPLREVQLLLEGVAEQAADGLNVICGALGGASEAEWR